MKDQCMNDYAAQLRELLYDKWAMESMSYDELVIEHPPSSFPDKIDELCVNNLPGHFPNVNLGNVPSGSEILESLMTTELEIAVTPYGNADSPVDNKYFAKPHLIYKPLKWLLEQINHKTSDNHYYFQSQDDNLQILKDCPVPKLLELPTKFLGPQQAANLWIGTEGTTSRLHSDNYDNIYIQVAGTKRMYLKPPGSIIEVDEKLLAPATYNDELKLVPDNLNNDDNAEDEMASVLFPTYNPATQEKRGLLWVVDLQPGDVLFLPALWYHQVEIVSPDVNISLNYWHQPFDDERRWAAWNFTRQMVRKISSEFQ